MKKMALLGILAALCLIAGCVTTDFYVRVPGPVVIVEEEDARVYYDDPRGWYVGGYWESGVWIAPFWTTDILILHQHFGHYRGPHRTHLENHFGRYPERFRGGHQGPGPGHDIRQTPPRQAPPRQAPPKNSPKKNPKKDGHRDEHRK